MAVLRNGLFDHTSQRDLMIAVLQEQSNSGDEHPAEHDRKELKKNALKARKELKDAKKLADKVAVGDVLESQLLSDQITLLRHLDLGLLEKKGRQAMMLTDMAQA